MSGITIKELQEGIEASARRDRAAWRRANNVTYAVGLTAGYVIGTHRLVAAITTGVAVFALTTALNWLTDRTPGLYRRIHWVRR